MEKEITANFTMEEPQRLEAKFEMTEGGKGTKDHSQLENRDLPDQHPISAITDLENTLAGKQANLSQAQIDATNSGITSSKVSTYDQYATSKQDKLSQAQQSAVDSGITSQKVETYDGYATSKQDKLSQGQQSAVDSGITSTKVGEYDNHIANKSNPHEVTKSQVGLGNADNTSDLDKPISTATQTALDGKVPVTRKVNDKALSADITLNATDVSALPNSTKYGASLSLTINSSTYVMTAQLKDQDGNDLGSSQTIDLPLESVVVSGSYDSQNKKVILTLQNGSTIEFSVADLVSGLQTEITSNNKLSADLVDDTSTTNKFVTTAEKDTWNAKQNALATQTAYSNKGSATKVPRITTNNLGQVTKITEVTITQPTVNNNTITITQGGTTKGSFTLNQNSDTTIALDAGGGSELPSQTGQAGKFLTTDGEQLSWAEVQGGGGSGEPIPLLNVVQTGAVEREGTVVYGFSPNDYLQLGDLLSGNSFQANTVKEFAHITPTANSWEVVFKINYVAGNSEQSFFSEGIGTLPSHSGDLCIDSGKMYMNVGDENGDYVSFAGTTTLVDGTTYWLKYAFTGTAYTMALSTDGETFTSEGSQNSSSKITRQQPWKIGVLNENLGGTVISEIDLEGCWIKADGEYVWKGVLPFISNGGSTVYTQTIFEGNIGSTLDVSPLSLSNAVAIERNGQKIYESSGGETRDYTISGSVITFTIPLIATDRIAVISSKVAPIDLTPYILKSDLKFLNIVETGALTRNGAVYSGFSTDDYLQIGNIVSDGYVSLTGTVKDFGLAIQNANNWEIVFKIKYKSSSSVQAMFGAKDLYFMFHINASHRLTISMGNGSGDWVIDLIGTTELLDDTIYWAKIEWTGTEYKTYLSTDGTNWNLENSLMSNFTLPYDNGVIWTIGKLENFYTWDGDINISDSYININNEIWWKGFETL